MWKMLYGGCMWKVLYEGDTTLYARCYMEDVTWKVLYEGVSYDEDVICNMLYGICYM